MGGEPGCPPCPASWPDLLHLALALAIAVVVAVAYFQLEKGKHGQVDGSATASVGIVQEMLMTMCDGYILLNQDGSIASADPGAEAIVGDGEDFREQIAGDGFLKPGQRRIRLPKHPQVEVYTLQTPLSAPLVEMVLGDRIQKKTENCGGLFLCCLRSHHEETRKKVKPAKSALPAGKPQFSLSPETGASKLRAGVLAPTRGSTIRATESACDSSLISAAQTQLESPNQASLCLPNTWESVQAVGLGVHSYEKVRPVGRGGQGTVWQVKDPDCEGRFLAQKEISLKGQLWHRDFPKRLRDADREIRALKQLSWAKSVVVPIVDCWIQTNFEQVYIVMEWLPCSLAAVLKEHRGEARHIPDQDLCRWFAQQACGVAAIHEAGLIHRDIKPDNILLDEAKRSCKIADLGVSRTTCAARERSPGGLQQAGAGARREMDDSKSALSSLLGASVLSAKAESMLSSYTARPGTSDYMSPEALRGGHYSTPMDVFGLGGVLLEMLTLKVLPGVPLGEVESRIPELCEEWLALDGAGQMVGLLRPTGVGKVSALPPMSERRKELRALCKSMLHVSPELRPAARDVVGRQCLKDCVEELGRESPGLRERLLRPPSLVGRPSPSRPPRGRH